MDYINEILAFNREFVANKTYENYKTDRFPTKKVAILTCMDTRLTTLLPAALNLKNGDAKIIKNAGAMISHPFGSVMRSLLVAVYELGADKILVIGHKSCGMQSLSIDSIFTQMKAKGIEQEEIDNIRKLGVDVDNWLKGFDSPEESVRETVLLIKNHPLIAKDIKVYGLLIDPETGEIVEV